MNKSYGLNIKIYFRLTIIDANCPVVLEDIVVPAYEFNKKFIENFEIDTIVTDGYRAYQENN